MHESKGNKYESKYAWNFRTAVVVAEKLPDHILKNPTVKITPEIRNYSDLCMKNIEKNVPQEPVLSKKRRNSYSQNVPSGQYNETFLEVSPSRIAFDGPASKTRRRKGNNPLNKVSSENGKVEDYTEDIRESQAARKRKRGEAMHNLKVATTSDDRSQASVRNKRGFSKENAIRPMTPIGPILAEESTRVKAEDCSSDTIIDLTEDLTEGSYSKPPRTGPTPTQKTAAEIFADIMRNKKQIIDTKDTAMESGSLEIIDGKPANHSALVKGSDDDKNDVGSHQGTRCQDSREREDKPRKRFRNLFETLFQAFPKTNLPVSNDKSNTSGGIVPGDTDYSHKKPTLTSHLPWTSSPSNKSSSTDIKGNLHSNDTYHSAKEPGGLEIVEGNLATLSAPTKGSWDKDEASQQVSSCKDSLEKEDKPSNRFCNPVQVPLQTFPKSNLPVRNEKINTAGGFVSIPEDTDSSHREPALTSGLPSNLSPQNKFSLKYTKGNFCNIDTKDAPKKPESLEIIERNSSDISAPVQGSCEEKEVSSRQDTQCKDSIEIEDKPSNRYHNLVQIPLQTFPQTNLPVCDDKSNSFGGLVSLPGDTDCSHGDPTLTSRLPGTLSPANISSIKYTKGNLSSIDTKGAAVEIIERNSANFAAPVQGSCGNHEESSRQANQYKNIVEMEDMSSNRFRNLVQVPLEPIPKTEEPMAERGFTSPEKFHDVIKVPFRLNLECEKRTVPPELKSTIRAVHSEQHLDCGSYAEIKELSDGKIEDNAVDLHGEVALSKSSHRAIGTEESHTKNTVSFTDREKHIIPDSSVPKFNLNSEETTSCRGEVEYLADVKLESESSDFSTDYEDEVSLPVKPKEEKYSTDEEECPGVAEPWDEAHLHLGPNVKIIKQSPDDLHSSKVNVSGQNAFESSGAEGTSEVQIQPKEMSTVYSKDKRKCSDPDYNYKDDCESSDELNTDDDATDEDPDYVEKVKPKKKSMKSFRRSAGPAVPRDHSEEIICLDAPQVSSKTQVMGTETHGTGINENEQQATPVRRRRRVRRKKKKRRNPLISSCWSESDIEDNPRDVWTDEDCNNNSADTSAVKKIRERRQKKQWSQLDETKNCTRKRRNKDLSTKFLFDVGEVSSRQRPHKLLVKCFWCQDISYEDSLVATPEGMALSVFCKACRASQPARGDQRICRKSNKRSKSPLKKRKKPLSPKSSADDGSDTEPSGDESKTSGKSSSESSDEDKEEGPAGKNIENSVASSSDTDVYSASEYSTNVAAKEDVTGPSAKSSNTGCVQVEENEGNHDETMSEKPQPTEELTETPYDDECLIESTDKRGDKESANKPTEKEQVDAPQPSTSAGNQDKTVPERPLSLAAEIYLNYQKRKKKASLFRPDSVGDCNNCSYSPRGLLDLIKHKWMVHGQYECLPCRIVFVLPEQLYTHAKMHMFDAFGKCGICQDIFENITYHYFTTHRDRHCMLCEERFSEYGRVYKPHMTHHITLKFSGGADQCPRGGCGYEVKTIDLLLQHMWLFHEEKCCPFCQDEISFETLDDLLRHVVSHKTELDHAVKTSAKEYISKKKSSWAKECGAVHPPDLEFTCDICSFPSHSLLGMTKHKWMIHKIENCTTCGEKYLFPAQLATHISIEKLQLKTCAQCGYKAGNFKDLTKHLWSKHEQRWCGVCFRECPTKDHLITSILSHLNQRLRGLDCPDASCKWTGSTPEMLVYHIYRKHGEKNCLFCDQPTRYNDNIWDHVLMHQCSANSQEPKVSTYSLERYSEKAMTEKCVLCSFVAPSAHIVYTHLWDEHGQRLCIVCGTKPYIYITVHQFMEHMDVHQSKLGTRANLSCFICGELCWNIGSKRNHNFPAHGTARLNFRCLKCGVKIAALTKAQDHHKVCTKTKTPRDAGPPQKCDECHRVLPSLSLLKTHIFNNHRSNVQCEVCGHKFPNALVWEAHRRTHTGEKPYQCTLCDKAFARSDNLHTHMRSHSGVKPYQCELCGKGFARGDNLKTHKKKMH